MNLHSKTLSSEPAPSAARQGRLADKVAVITGAASGMTDCVHLCPRGAKVTYHPLKASRHFQAWSGRLSQGRGGDFTTVRRA